MRCKCWCKCGCDEPYYQVNHKTKNCPDCDEGKHEVTPGSTLKEVVREHEIAIGSN